MRITRSADRACRPLACPGGYYKPLDGYGSWISLTATPRRPRIKRSAGRAYRPPADRVDGNHFMVSWITGITELPLPDHAMYILHVVQPADITLQGFLFAAQFLTVNSGGRFFNRTPSVLLSSTSERPGTAKTTQHPDPSTDPQVDPSHPSPYPSFPLCSSDLMSRSKYWSASGPILLRSPSPPSPPWF